MVAINYQVLILSPDYLKFKHFLSDRCFASFTEADSEKKMDIVFIKEIFHIAIGKIRKIW